MNDVVYFLKTNYYVPTSVLMGIVYTIWRKKNFRDSIAIITIAVILGSITFNGIESLEVTYPLHGKDTDILLNMLYDTKGGVVSLVGLLSELIYKIIVNTLISIPKIIQRKLNLKEDCKL